MTDTLRRAQALEAAARDGTLESEEQWKKFTTVARKTWLEILEALAGEVNRGAGYHEPLCGECPGCKSRAALTHVDEQLKAVGA